MAKFQVQGPFPIPVHQGVNGRVIRKSEADEFFKQHRSLEAQKGCYIFGIRAGRGVTPLYVGKATKTFKQECFASGKLQRYGEALVSYRRGTPVLYLVVAPGGRPATAQIAALENFLIGAAAAKNPAVLNVKGTKKPAWSVDGVIPGGRGRPTDSARSLKSCLGL